jgi:hypothetical protein
MKAAYLTAMLFILSTVSAFSWQMPLDQMTLANRIAAEKILHKPDFTFQTATSNTNVSYDTMEKLFDRPRLAAAMWRECQFVPKFYAFVLPNHGLAVDDANGLHGTMKLAYRKPGMRVYLIDGTVERWRMGNPFAVSAKMLVIYKYKADSKGFHGYLQTWTALDSALLGMITKPFRKYIQYRQEEFIAYIMSNIAKGGEFAEKNYDDFLSPIQREGDYIATRHFMEVFKGHY